MTDLPKIPVEPAVIRPEKRAWIIGASLMALFMAAMDSLILSIAMPTIVAELGGMHLFSWVYTGYLLTRAVALPIFGKLADILNTRALFVFTVGLFIAASVLSGISRTMFFLIAARTLQGIAAGGIFALVYIILSAVSTRDHRAKTLALAGIVWGVASFLGPTTGGFIVTLLSWRWIFFINVLPGIIALMIILFYFTGMSPTAKKADLDILGIVTFSITIFGLLMIIMLGGGMAGWNSPLIIGLILVTMVSGLVFIRVEEHAVEPIIAFRFFKIWGYSTSNSAAFFGSMSIFVLAAFAPLLMQGALGMTVVQVGIVMMSFSLGSAIGTYVVGQVIDRVGCKLSAVICSGFIVGGSMLTMTFTPETGVVFCFWVFFFLGVGIGGLVLATMLIVQNSMEAIHLGVATTSNQFARTIGGTIGISICGRLVSSYFSEKMEILSSSGALKNLPDDMLVEIRSNVESLFRPEIMSLFPDQALAELQKFVADGVFSTLEVVLVAASLSFLICLMLPVIKKKMDMPFEHQIYK